MHPWIETSVGSSVNPRTGVSYYLTIDSGRHNRWGRSSAAEVRCARPHLPTLGKTWRIDEGAVAMALAFDYPFTEDGLLAADKRRIENARAVAVRVRAAHANDADGGDDAQLAIAA